MNPLTATRLNKTMKSLKMQSEPYSKNSFMSSSESSACFALLLIIVLNSSKSICPFPSVSTSPSNRILRTIFFYSGNPQIHVRETLTIISWSSSSEGFWPISLKTAPNSFAVTVPSPFLSMRSNAALYSDTEVLLLASILPILDMARILSRLIVIFEIIWVMILLYWSKN